MKKFIVIYNSPKEAMEMMKNVTPEQAEEGMKPWLAWAEKCGDGLLEMGAPLGNRKMVTTSGISPVDSETSGYSILQAENMDKAIDMLKDHPHLKWVDGCTIEIYEAMPIQ